MITTRIDWDGKQNIVVLIRVDGAAMHELVRMPLDDFMTLGATRYAIELALERAGLGLAALLPESARAEAPDPE